jgi:hypothetical protein
LIKPLFAILGGIAGAFIGAPVLAMAGAQILTWIYGNFEGSAAMGGAKLGGVAGLPLGFGGGIWLVLRKEGRWAGTALTWLWVGAFLILLCLGFVAFS